MSPIPALIATCLVLSACVSLPPPDEATAPPADPVIGWARVSFDADGITGTEAGGLADVETGRAMTVDDPVRVASVSKLVVALGVLRLAEAGTLDLDGDVSTYLGWPLRNPAFPHHVITLRHLLGHRSSVRDDAGYALPLDADLETWMHQPGAWNAEHEPGAWFHYANLNLPVIAAVMEGATGERFDRIMARDVFEPLGLDACFNWTTCSSQARARAVILYEPDGTPIRDTRDFIAAGCPATPASDGSCDLETYVLARNGGAFSPQGGLRISARDLAKLGSALFRRDEDFLPSLTWRGWMASAANRIGSGTGDPEDGYYCAYGLALHAIDTPFEDCRDDAFGDGHVRLGHSGEAYGLRSGVWLPSGDDGISSSGVAYFATGLPEKGALPGRSAFTAVEERLAQGLPLETFVPVE